MDAEESSTSPSDPCHVSVMPDEVVEYVALSKPKVIIDGTFGAGGHSRRMLELIDADGLIIGMDRDPAVSARQEALEQAGQSDPRLSVFLGSYEQSPKALQACGLEQACAMVLDLGLSSDQLADRSRGFSFQHDGPLDLRFDPERGVPASQWLARHSEKEIADAIYQFGEERFSRRIAREVIRRAREGDAVQTVAEMADVCRRCVPRGKNHDIHPATRTFQALRIAVNDELGILQRTLASCAEWIRKDGMLVVISFHSLEDRFVKHAMRDDDRWEVVTRKPLRPTDAEIDANPRSRSAKLRVAKRL